MNDIIMEENKEKFEKYYEQIKHRDSKGLLLSWLKKHNFFIKPASLSFHSKMPGGLLFHSMNVIDTLLKFKQGYNLKINDESCIIVGLCHDLCKAEQYSNHSESFIWNRFARKGHANLSLQILEENQIILSNEEKEMIQYHMGYYGTFQFGSYGEYSLFDLSDINNKNKNTIWVHYADMFATHNIETDLND